MMNDIVLNKLPKEFYERFIKSNEIRQIKSFAEAELEFSKIPEVTGIKLCILSHKDTHTILLRCNQLQYDIAFETYQNFEQAVLALHVKIALFEDIEDKKVINEKEQ
jgi:hypothetical protein